MLKLSKMKKKYGRLSGETMRRDTESHLDRGEM